MIAKHKASKTNTKLLKFKDFSLELAYYSGSTVYDQWLQLLNDLGDYADFYWDMPQMQYDLVKSDKEWQKFLSHPERQPFKIRIKEWHAWSIEQLYQRTLEIIQLSVTLLRSAKTPKECHQKIKDSLATIVKGMVHSRYNKYEMELSDSYVGITPKMRAEGNMYVTETMKARFDYFISVAALESNRQPKEIHAKLLAACQNNLARLGEFFATCQFSDELKDIYSAYTKAAKRDMTMPTQNIVLGFTIWKELYEHGVDMDTYLELLGYPNADTVKKRLLKFASDKEVLKEIVTHFKNERPESYKTWKQKGEIPYMSIFQEEARIFKQPTKLRTDNETRAMIETCQQKISAYFPLSTEESPRQLIFNSIHPFAVKRAYQSQTKNHEMKSINITVMTPTTDSEHDYLETLAHETTHAIHSIILHRAAEFSVLTKEQADQVPTSVLEDFSQLVEGQFKSTAHSKNSTVKAKYFTSFMQALASWSQVPFSIVQLEIREKFEILLKKGVTELSSEFLEQLQFEYDMKLQKLWEGLLHFTRPSYTAFDWFMPLAPYDALVYMKRFIVLSKNKMATDKPTAKKKLSMNEALSHRFGVRWIASQDGRILLYWLLLETGRNHATEDFGDIILKKDTCECLEELQRIGISAQEFSQRT
ncbi:hypothetical protein CO112_04160 [Candidatus Dojkabacteria bacterium CG_4_9_14_3_um_filter_150_Dojkabacteria_WS6_41_13]|uniref:Peptidase M3A/M3B catalytic domain-containing protein n=1 Tax=Candidatus Dojkabacteria bacterium CG_4_10_14_0_2_um_filter_Dojkabacteria_WS6_41_15 TaxID=2014249 RepID=A0A2M7W2F4_9BACT|nr:MAG: hypothetical protein COZ14_01570 [Candidatus Dojkabacteria bacterium CG_4_10_14_3_um_filter_Dojkabacteria_WS6_41_9]PJA14768.1 MAG: hypothetical protein COX64_01620 [Candidatus Dojkabacteria bacterium CG_4_10_14_0_2_um_filter_Dojkabacteria_WS6_41_15]PJB22504.1 MAG: hypothetical protein CO112_04160 [Candidatus Dojkabacteria bacterium CG_4_9_14_3_um_filter_150_Dojkabacteria_WS6_41_13]